MSYPSLADNSQDFKTHWTRRAVGVVGDDDNAGFPYACLATLIYEVFVELGGFAPVPVPVSSPDLFPKTLTLRTYTLLHD